MASVEERLKLKRGQVEPWSTREKLCLASSVVRSGNQNWMSVSRSLRVFGGEPGRPADWFSQKSCAVQYDNLLTQIETPKRKKRGADGSKSEGPDLTPAEVIVKQLTGERIEELRVLMTEAREVYLKEKDELYRVENGLADDKLDEMIAEIQEEKKQKEAEQEEHQRWLRQREERKQELEMAFRPHVSQQHVRGTIRRHSNQSELGSETDNIESPSSSSDQIVATEELSESKPTSTPTSPLLTSLLKSPSPVTGSQSSSILHSAITSQRGASPTITSLLNSSPSVPSSSTSLPLSPNLKSLVSNALAGHDEVPKPPSHNVTSSPTLSRLLELPPSTPGKLPELPYSPAKQSVSTSPSKTDSMSKEPVHTSNNTEVVTSVDTVGKPSEVEIKDNLEGTDVQQLSNDELEYVVDSSIDVVLQEFVPEGLVDDMAVYIVSSDDVETDVGNLLEATESSDPSVPEQRDIKLETTDNDSKEPSEETQEKSVDVPVSVVVHTSPSCQTPQRSAITPPSTAASPRSVGRPPKVSMTPRKIVMEEEEPSQSDSASTTDVVQQAEESSKALSREDLENASVLFVQDNGEVVKLSENIQPSGMIDNIHVIQDSSNNSIVVLPHEDAIKGTSVESQKSSDSDPGDANENSVMVEESISSSPQREKHPVGRISPSKTPHKSGEKIEVHVPSPDKNLHEGSGVNLEGSTTEVSEIHPDPKECADADFLPMKEENSLPEANAQEETKTCFEDSKEEDNAILPLKDVAKKHKMLPSSRRDKSPVISESSNEVASEEDAEVAEDIKKADDSQMQDKELNQAKSKSVSLLQVEDESTRSSDNEGHTITIKEEKVSRANTPSTEDDNTRDTEAPPPVRRGRGRYARDSTTNSDSLPNSPVPTVSSHDDEKEHRAWKKSIMLVYNRIATHKNASIFFKPITDDKAPGYSSMIRRPQDLQTIKKNIEKGEIRTTDEFERDILLMLYNAIMYNKSGSPVYDMAQEMQDECAAHLEEYRKTQMILQNEGTQSGLLSSRRGTRTAEKRDVDSEWTGSRRSLSEKPHLSRGGVFSTNRLGKRKQSFPDDKPSLKRRKDEDSY